MSLPSGTGTPVYPTILTLLQPSLTARKSSVVRGRRKFARGIGALRKVVCATFLWGTFTLWHQVAVIVIADRCILAHTPQISSLPSLCDQRTRLEVVERYLEAGYDRPFCMNRCNPWKDVRLILEKTRLFRIDTQTDDFVPKCSPAALAFSFPFCVFSSYWARLETRSSPFLILRYYSYSMLTAKGLFSASFTCFAHSHNSILFAGRHPAVFSCSPSCLSSLCLLHYCLSPGPSSCWCIFANPSDLFGSTGCC